MGILARLFPGQDVRAARQYITQLEGELSSASSVLGPALGLDVIKNKLRNYIMEHPENLRAAKQKNPSYSIEVLTQILARNMAWEELASGRHMMVGTTAPLMVGTTAPLMTGQGLIALHDHLADLLEKAGVQSSKEAGAELRGMIKARFG